MPRRSPTANDAEVRAGCHPGDVMLGRRGVAVVSCCVPRKAAGCTAFLDARREMTPPVPRAPRPVGESRPTYRSLPRKAAGCTAPCREMPSGVPRRAGRGRPAAAGLVQRAAFLDAHPDKTVQRAAFLGADGPRPVQGGAFLARGSPRLVRPAVFLGTPASLVARRWAHLTRSPAIPERAAVRGGKVRRFRSAAGRPEPDKMPPSPIVRFSPRVGEPRSCAGRSRAGRRCARPRRRCCPG